MPDGNPNRDFNSFLDDKIKYSLSEGTSSGFTNELMKRVAIEKEFAKEDVKTYRLAKIIIGTFVSLLLAFSVVLSIVVNTGETEKETGFFESIVDKFSSIIESISVATLETLGIGFDLQTGMIILLVMFCVFIFSFADKIIFKKGIR